MRRSLHHALRIGTAILLLLFACIAGAATPTAAVIATFQFAGGDIVGLSAGGDGEVAVYDRTPGVSNSVMRFLQAAMVEGEVEVTQAPQTIVLAGEPPGFKGWMLRDNGILFALSAYNRSTSYGLSSWEQMWLYMISDRTVLNAINYNGTAEIEGDEPASAPEDFRYAVSGFALKPVGVEGSGNFRLVVDDTLKGNIDILDIDYNTLALLDQVRHSYRARHENGCQWPDIEYLPSYTCTWPSLNGNGLALDWTFETRVSVSERSLYTNDEIYILDPIYSKSHLRRLAISHPGLPFSAETRSEIDLATGDPMLNNGVESLYPEPRIDRVRIASGIQSFNEGYVPTLDTLHLTVDLLDPVFGDQDMLIDDPGSTSRWFVPVADSFAYPSSLILREVVDGSVVKSTTALTNYTDDTLDAAAFDPNYGLVYLAIDDTVYVVSVSTPDGDDRDGDGLPNDYETGLGLDPDDPEDARLDVDGDGWNYVDEYNAGTDPNQPDSDGDGIGDGSDPLPLHQDACTAFIVDGRLSDLEISGVFTCQLSTPLTIEGSVEVTATGNADIRARSLLVHPTLRSRQGGKLRLKAQ